MTEMMAPVSTSMVMSLVKASNSVSMVGLSVSTVVDSVHQAQRQQHQAQANKNPAYAPCGGVLA